MDTIPAVLVRYLRGAHQDAAALAHPSASNVAPARWPVSAG